MLTNRMNNKEIINYRQKQLLSLIIAHQYPIPFKYKHNSNFCGNESEIQYKGNPGKML